MKLYQIDNQNTWIQQESLTKALGIYNPKNKVIAVIGAGGKTTLIHHLAKELASSNKKVIITTTTHMFLPKEYGVLEENKNLLLTQLSKTNIAVAGIPSKEAEGKMTKTSDTFYQWMKTVSDYILVEADGSKRLPIKVPASHEPVLPIDTNTVIIVAGLSSLNHPLKEKCHRHEIGADLLNTTPEHIISPKDIADLIVKGYYNNISLPQKIVLNQCDTTEFLAESNQIIQHLNNMGVDKEHVVTSTFL